MDICEPLSYSFSKWSGKGFGLFDSHYSYKPLSNLAVTSMMGLKMLAEYLLERDMVELNAREHDG